MSKLTIVLDLVRKGVITDQQAQELLQTEKEYIHQPYYHPYRWYGWPYYQAPGTYCGSTNALLNSGSITYTDTPYMLTSGLTLTSDTDFILAQSGTTTTTSTTNEANS